jgi:hypothetical protein
MALFSRTGICTLAMFVCVCMAFSQQSQKGQKQKVAWDEYVYREYGFAITAPQVPKESSVSSGTQYRLYWDEDADIVVNLTAEKDTRDCSIWFAAAKKTDEDSKINRAAMIAGTPTVENNGMRNSLQAGYERLQCINGRMYHFEAGWPKDQKKPPIVDRIVKSFRVLPVKAKQ